MSASAALWLSIILGSCAQVFLKRGVTPSGSSSSEQRSYLSLLRSPWFWAWAFSFVIATGLWLLAVARIPVSYAFPMLSTGYVIVAVLSILLLKERVPAMRWIAILVITIGVVVISRN